MAAVAYVRPDVRPITADAQIQWYCFTPNDQPAPELSPTASRAFRARCGVHETIFERVWSKYARPIRANDVGGRRTPFRHRDELFELYEFLYGRVSRSAYGDPKVTARIIKRIKWLGSVMNEMAELSSEDDARHTVLPRKSHCSPTRALC